MANNTFDNRKFMDYAINHVNDDHWKEMVQIVQANTTIRDVSDVTLLDYNPKGMEVIVARNNRDEQKIQINFPCVLNSPHDFRSVLVAMVKMAREKLEE